MTPQLGAFSFREDRTDGSDLRTLTYNGEEVTSRVYFAVRDPWWRTVPLAIRRRSGKSTSSGFIVEINAVAAWTSHPIEVDLRYTAEGSRLTAEFNATTLGPLEYCRIGFCVLLAATDLQGRSGRSVRSGTPTTVRFPAQVTSRDHRDPDAVGFHRPFDRLETELASGTRVTYTFQGEEFELEDQRNWTDVTYKAYSLEPPGARPHFASAGCSFHQSVCIDVQPAVIRVEPEAERLIRIGDPIGAIPPITLFSGRISPHSWRPAGGFSELNANRPTRRPLETFDAIELGVNGAVHAADDDSVLETATVHGRIAEQARAMYPQLPLHLGPLAFLDTPGDWRDATGGYIPEPPPGPPQLRQMSSLGATWAIVSAAHAIPAGVASLRYFNTAVPADSPAAQAVDRLSRLTDRPALSVTAPAPLAGIAALASDGEHIILALANPSPDAVTCVLPNGHTMTMAGFAAEWFELPWPDLPIEECG